MNIDKQYLCFEIEWGLTKSIVSPQNLHRRKQRKRLWRLLPKAKFGRNDRKHRNKLLVTLPAPQISELFSAWSLGAPKKSMAEPLHIIKTEFCISSNSQNLYIIIAKEDATYGWWYTPTAMIYTPKCDDIPLLSQWIKKTTSSCLSFFGRNDRKHRNKSS